MPILNVIQYPNPILKKKAKAIRTVDGRTKALIKNMITTMYAASGIGLAAPQVGELVRIIVLDVGEGEIVLVNPKITKKKGKQIFKEGCLCLPGVEAPVERASHIIITGLDEKGKKITLEAEGLLATVFQHEVDHLEGKVFIDRVSDPKLIKYIVPAQESPEERM